ncbi:endonuclease domain-containing protein [Nonomuraea cavernae]|uniref:endonuclease domain-containing protein n=1 Tax=Nonomuraea cavernae TaxID=2045107 RepID=UPI0033ECB887
MRSWARLPVGRPVWLDGADTETVALATDPLPDDAPAIVTYLPAGARSTTGFVAAALCELQRTAVALFPAWLPGAEGLDGPGGAGIAAVRTLALRRASASDHFGPFLAELAELALSGRPDAPSGFSPETRAAGLARVIATSFGRSRLALLVDVPAGLSPAGQEVLVAGCEWLAQRGELGVWLTGAPLNTDRLQRVTPPLNTDRAQPVTPPLETDRLRRVTSVVGEEVRPRVSHPAVAGRPHPGSRSEQALEAALAPYAWAAGRAWNQTYRPHPLAAPVRVDLLWQDERCVVEIDGPEHRGPRTFDEDRRRDVRLQLAGYAVLRFTDSHVMTDPQAVVRQIELYLSRRRGTPEG